MTVLLIAILVLVAAGGTGVALTRDPAKQIVGVSGFGMVLAVMFMAFQAPDVALSQIVIGAVGLPLMVLLSLAKLRRDAELREQRQKQQQEQAAAGGQAS